MNTLHIFYVPGRNVNSQMRTQEVTKDCFPPATKCSNCTRKNRDDVTGKSKEKKEYKRCSGCHLFAYCDKDCQREHWIRVHKKHCRLLSGKEVVPGSKHSIDSCQLCSDERESANADLKSGNSPKTFCHIEELILMLKTGLNFFFKFHKDETTCKCSLILAACELPFQLGELTGQYVNNLDAMLAHALKVVRAMGANDFSLKENLTDLWKALAFSRSQMWYEVLSGVKRNNIELIESAVENVETLKDIYGATNPWWKTLKFSVNLIKHMCDDERYGDMYDSSTTEDPRFETLKLVIGKCQSQLRNKAIVSENNLWFKFKLWPVLWNNSLAVVLPEGTRCQICSKTLSGPVRITQYDDNSLPGLFSCFGENGEMEACCSFVDNPKCARDIIKDITEEQLIKFKEEMTFLGPRARICDVCFKLSIFSHRCSACRAAQYCSTQCLQEDLDFHKTVCARWSKDRSRKIRGSKTQMKVSKVSQILKAMELDSFKELDDTKEIEAKELDEAKKLEAKELDEAKKMEEVKKLKDKELDEAKELNEAKKRLLNEFKQIESDPPEGVTCAPEGDNIMVWKAVIFGPDQTVFQNGIFQLTLEFSGEYPYEPPVVTFLSQMFHPNIDGDTGMMKGILMGNWSPAYRVLDILMTLRFLLVEPNMNGVYVANTEAAQLFKENRRLYNKKAQESVQKSWST